MNLISIFELPPLRKMRHGQPVQGGIFFIIFGGGNIYSTLSLSSERRGRFWEGYASTRGPIYNARRKNKKIQPLPYVLPPLRG